jgi:hypothetical protein
MKQPKKLLVNASSEHNWINSATSFWITNDSTGDSIYINWFGSGWVCQFQQSYLTKAGVFVHKDDIPSFKHSHMPTDQPWDHVFETKENALLMYKKFFTKKTHLVEIYYNLDDDIFELKKIINELSANHEHNQYDSLDGFKNELEQAEKTKADFLEKSYHILSCLKPGRKIEVTNKQNHSMEGEFSEILSPTTFLIKGTLRGRVTVDLLQTSKLEVY